MARGPCVLVRRSCSGADGAVAFDLSQLFASSDSADLTVGRRFGCAVPLTDPSSRISRQRATLSRQQLSSGRLVLSVTGHGSHGTFVDGKELPIGTPQQLNDGAVISFADGPTITRNPAARGQPNDFTFVLRNVAALTDGAEHSSMVTADTGRAALPVAEPPTPSEQDVQSPARQMVKPGAATADTAKSPPPTVPRPRPKRSAGAAAAAAAAAASELEEVTAKVSAAAAAVAATTAAAGAPGNAGDAANTPAVRPPVTARKSRGGRGAEPVREGGVEKPQAKARSSASNGPATVAAETPAASGSKPASEAAKRKQSTGGSPTAAAAVASKDQAGPSNLSSGRKTAKARKTKENRVPRAAGGETTPAGEAAKRKRPAGGDSGSDGAKSSEKKKRVKQEPLPPVDIPEAVEGQEMVWPRGSEPWRACGLPVNEELDLEAGKVTAIKKCSQYYYECFRKERETQAARCLNEDGTVKRHEDGKAMSQRPDLSAATNIKKQKRSLTERKFVGHFPGLNISDSFYARAEISTLGMHFPPVAGIDYVGGGDGDRHLLAASRGVRFATSIMVAGCYKDDSDDGHELWYTGQGGNDLLGNKAQIADQKLKLGNLALVGNMRLGIPVRVTRVQSDRSTIYGRAFIYDGLYDVIKYVNESGKDNKFVYRYKLRRRPNQGQLITERVKFGAFSSSKEKHALSCPGIIDTDISGGLEATIVEGCQIPACNEIDDIPPPCSSLARMPTQEQCRGVAAHDPPPDWEPTSRYIIDMELPDSVQWPAPPVEPERFAKSNDPHAWIKHLNGGSLPYMGNSGKKPPTLVACRRVVYECGPWNTRCPDGSKCVQRVTQQGIKFRLQLVRSRETGWGVISWDMIPSGAFVAVYYGKVITFAESEVVDDDSYLMDLGPRTDFDKKGNKLPEGEWDKAHVPKWTVDAKPAGGVARFVNHSCAPNLFIQPVLTRHHDEDMTYQAFFANANIPAGTPLTFDYGHDYINMNLNGKCCCGAPDCRQPVAPDVET